MKYVRMHEFDIDKLATITDDNIKLIKSIIEDKYSNVISDLQVIDNKMICCSWFKGIDMRITAGDEFPINIASDIYKSLSVYGMESIDRGFLERFSSRRINYGLCNFNESYIKTFIETIINMFYEYSLLLLPKKYIDYFNNPRIINQFVLSKDDYDNCSWSSIIESTFGRSAEILDDSKDKFVIVVYENLIFEFILNNRLIINRYCNEKYSFEIFNRTNSYNEFNNAINELITYSTLIMQDEWLRDFF